MIYNQEYVDLLKKEIEQKNEIIRQLKALATDLEKQLTKKGE